MASVLKRGPVWYAKGPAPAAKRRREPIQAPSKAEAKALADELEVEARRRRRLMQRARNGLPPPPEGPDRHARGALHLVARASLPRREQERRAAAFAQARALGRDRRPAPLRHRVASPRRATAHRGGRRRLRGERQQAARRPAHGVLEGEEGRQVGG